jgi:hypothetical protein
MYNTGNALPKISNLNSNSNSLTKVSTNISKRQQQFGLTELQESKGSNTNFYSNKPSLANQEEIISQRRAIANIATPSTPNREMPMLDYQMALEQRNYNRKKPTGGKIILKKINHFTDNLKLNKTYKTANEAISKVQSGGRKSGMQKYEDNKKTSNLYVRE